MLINVKKYIERLVVAMLLISACLAGEKCRYDCKGYDIFHWRKLVTDGLAIPVCPEVLGGLSVPREPCEIVGGDGFDVLAGKARVVTAQGVNMTEAFLRGAFEVLKIIRAKNIREAVLKERSPSCGSRLIYDGTFEKRLRPGYGCTGAVLRREGIKLLAVSG